jgi:hypothetical protein
MSLLAALPVGVAVLTPRRNDWRPLLNHGWVEPLSVEEANNQGHSYDGTNMYLAPLRITAEGLRALADAVEQHGQPQPAQPQSQADARWFGAANPHAATGHVQCGSVGR